MANAYIRHALNELKGWPRDQAIDYVASLAPGTLPAPLWGGRVVHVNAAQQFEPGVTGGQMGIFLLNSSIQFDVTNDPSDPSILGWTPIAPTGAMSGLVAIGGYELETTEFDVTKTYAPNDSLKSPTAAECTGALGVSVAGMLFKDKSYAAGGGPLVRYTDAICGIVSRSNTKSEYGVPILAFWPVYVPSTTG